MPDRDIQFKISVPGSDDCIAKIDQIKRGLESLRSGSAASYVGVNSHIPAGASANAPLAPPAPGTSAPAFAGSSQSLFGPIPMAAPGAAYGGHYAIPPTPPPPAAPGTSGYAGGSGIAGALVPTQPIGNVGGGHSSVVSITAMTVQIMATTVNIVSTGAAGGGGGGAIGGGGAPPAPGTGGGGWGGGGMPSPGAPSWSGFLNAMARNPTLGGAAHAVMQDLPIGMLAGAGMAATAVGTGLNGYLAATAPGYNLDTYLQGAVIRGQYIPPSVQAAMRNKADAERTLAIGNAISAPLEAIPLLGPMFGKVIDLVGRRNMERNVSLLGDRVEQSELLYRTSGLNLPSYGVRSDSLSLAVQAAEMSRAFGAGGTAGALRGDYSSYRRMGATDSGMMAGVSAIDSIAARPEYGNLFRQRAGGASPLSLGRMALPALVAEGNIAGIEALRQARSISNDEAASAEAQARQMQEVGNTLRTGQAGIGSAQSGLSLLQSSGAGYRAIASQMRVIGGSYGPIAGALQQELAAAQAAGNAPRVAELQAQLAGIGASVQGQNYAATMTMFSGRGVENQAAISQAGTAFSRSMYGPESGTIAAFGGRASASRAEIQRLREMSQSSVIAPEQRAMYAAQAAQMEAQVAFELPREQGQFSLGLRSGEVGIAGARAGYGMASASLFGNASDIYRASQAQIGVIGSQIGLTQGRLRGDYGPMTQGERLDAQRELIDLMRQEATARTEAVRSYYSLNVSIAQTSASIAGSQQSRSQMMGVGGVEGFGFAQRSYQAAQSVAGAAGARVAALRAAGVKSDSPEMMQAVAAQEAAETSATAAGLGRANVPISSEVQRAMNRNSFEQSALDQLPFAFGAKRGVLQRDMGDTSKAIAEVKARREAQRAANGGRLSSAEESSYEQELYPLVNRGLGDYSQLSYGWQAGLISQSFGSPNSVALLDPTLSYKSATRNGVRSPAFGGRSGDVQRYLQDAGMISAVLGGESSPVGAASAAMSGGRMGGAPTVRLEGGAHLTISGTVSGQPFTGTGFLDQTNKGASMDTSQAGMGEFLRQQGIGTPVQR